MDAAIIRALRGIVGGQFVYDGPAELMAYSLDGTFQQKLPEVVVAPRRIEEVAEVLRLANGEGIPVVARGAGTNLVGGTIPMRGGIMLSLARMNAVKEIDLANSVAVVEPGVVTAHLQDAVDKQSLFYPPDPASVNQCTIGGNVACNSGGPRCLKYGVTKDYVLGMVIARPGGQLMRLGGKLFKNSTGYQLIQLMVGSEGTLGVIVELTLRLIPLPKSRSTAMAIFSRLEDAAETVPAIMASGILPAALEIMDNTTIGVVEDYLATGLPRDAEAVLILEQDGAEPVVAREVAEMAAICEAKGATAVHVATEQGEREELWRARRAVAGALGRCAPSRLSEDIVVPLGQLPAMIRRVRQIAREQAILIPVFGHAGDGNLHPNVLFDPREPGVLGRVERATGAILEAALELGGTLSGEHGIGIVKRQYLSHALGEPVVALMRDIKRAFDPRGILNPGKVFPEGESTEGFLAALPRMGMLGEE